MFQVDPATFAITMHRGDTGAFWITATRKSGSDFSDGDVALLEIKSGNDVKMFREYNLNPETPTDMLPGDGKFLVAFLNSDTDTWAAGAYQTEVRIVIDPIRDYKVVTTVTGDLEISVDEDSCLAQFDDDQGEYTIDYDGSDWSDDISDYGITITDGTPVDGDYIVIQYNKTADGSVIDGSTVRTIIKSSLTIEDVIIDI